MGLENNPKYVELMRIRAWEESLGKTFDEDLTGLEPDKNVWPPGIYMLEYLDKEGE